MTSATSSKYMVVTDVSPSPPAPTTTTTAWPINGVVIDAPGSTSPNGLLSPSNTIASPSETDILISPGATVPTSITSATTPIPSEPSRRGSVKLSDRRSEKIERQVEEKEMTLMLSLDTDASLTSPTSIPLTRNITPPIKHTDPTTASPVVVKKPLLVHVESSTKATDGPQPLPSVGGGTGTGGTPDITRNSTLRRGSSSGPVPPKTNVNKSKLMALTGEMLPQNALDPTGYEQNDKEDEEKRFGFGSTEGGTRAGDVIKEAVEAGLITLDAFGQPIYPNKYIRYRLEWKKKWRGCWKVYDPASPNRQYWSLLVVIFLLYGMIEIPLRVGFEMDVTPWSAADIFNLFIDIFFLIDIVMNFRTGFYQEDNMLVLDERKIAYKYLRSWFLLDFVTSVPLSQLLQAFIPSSENGSLAVLSLPRILRVFRIARLFKIFRMLKLMNVMSSWSESSNEKLFSLILKVMKFVTLIFLLSHLSGCVWGFIALQQKDVNGNFHHLSWPFRYGIYNYQTDTSFAHLYLLSLYWALATLTTVGYGDIHAGSGPEYAFCIILTFVGTCCFGYIIGTISSILKHGKETETLYLSRMTELNLYMSYRKISPYLQKKIRRHYEYLWKRQTLYNETEILAELPNYLQSDLSVYLYKDLIQKVPFLADMGPDCSMLVILKLKPLQFSPGGFIFTKGALGREMFFVSKGVVEVINGPGYIICQLKEGSYFGEYAILSEKPVYRTASIRARTFVDLLSLSKNDFELIWSLYPEIYAKIILRAKEQWQVAIEENREEIEKQQVKNQAAGGKGLTTSTMNLIDQQLKDPDAVEDEQVENLNKRASKKLQDLTPFGLEEPVKLASFPLTSKPTTNGVAKASSIAPSGDTVIRIEKSEGIGAENEGALSIPIKTADEEDDQQHTEEEEEEDDDGYYETSYIDSLEGLESENDEDFDIRRDIIDLPDHLLPPPKPIIIGSFVSKHQAEAGAATTKEEEDDDALLQQARAAQLTAAGRVKTFFAGTSTTHKPEHAHRDKADRKSGGALTINVKRASGGLPKADAKDGTPVSPPTDSKTDRMSKEMRRRSSRASGGALPASVNAAIISPADERRMQREKEKEKQKALEMATLTANGEQPHSTIPGSAAHKANFLSGARDGLKRGSVFSSVIGQSGGLMGGPTMTAKESESSFDTIHEDENENVVKPTLGLGSGSTAASNDVNNTSEVSRVSILKKQHQKKANQLNGLPPSPSPPPSSEPIPTSPDSNPPSPLLISAFTTPQMGPTNTIPTLLQFNKTAGSIMAPVAEARLQINLQQLQHQQSDQYTYPDINPEASPSNLIPFTTQPSPVPSLGGLTSSPVFWTSLQTMLQRNMQPLQDQYQSLMQEHLMLQSKQVRTEELLRTMVQKLKDERAESQRAKAALAAVQAVNSIASPPSAGLELQPDSPEEKGPRSPSKSKPTSPTASAVTTKSSTNINRKSTQNMK